MSLRLVPAFALALAACSTNGASDSSNAPAADSAITGPSIASCVMWSGSVSCQYTAPTAYPIKVSSVVVTVLGGSFTTADLTDGTVHALGAQTGGSASLLIQVKLAVGADDLVSAPVQSEALDLLKQTITVTEGQTQSVALPFVLWPIHLDAVGEMEGARTNQFSVSVAPWTTFLDAGTVTRQIDLARATPGTHSDFFVLVDSTTKSLAGTATFCDAQGNCTPSTAFQITGAGSYQVTASGLVAGTATSTPPDMATAPPTSTPDLSTAPPATTCGGDGQASCPTGDNQGCIAGCVYNSADNLCHLCGADGQLSCSTQANQGCNPGFVYTSSDNLCHVCGADGQLSCSTSANEGCNAGLTYSSSDNRCHAS